MFSILDDRWDGPSKGKDDRGGRGEENAAATPAPARPVQVPPDLSDMRKFLTTPIPKDCGIIQCHIRRNKSGTNKLFPVYSLYLKVFCLLHRSLAIWLPTFIGRRYLFDGIS